MPRTADTHLEKRILDAGYKLWSKGGASALTMRVVAKAAGTTTPTVYERFRDKHDLIRFLQARARQEMFAATQPARSAQEACRRALDFMLTHGHEYSLLTYDWAVQLERREPMPTFEFLKKLLARELGDAPRKHTSLVLALVALIHGTAGLLLAENPSGKTRSDVRRACLAACESLIRSPSRMIPEK
ncbi:MAG: TetR/AcrR family transcriptional regulator [Candidatus Acidiferrum sp.]